MCFDSEPSMVTSTESVSLECSESRTSGGRRRAGFSGRKSMRQQASLCVTCGKVARWFAFKPKIPIWLNFVGPLNRKCCYHGDQMKKLPKI
jgi:hypothetical protein